MFIRHTTCDDACQTKRNPFFNFLKKFQIPDFKANSQLYHIARLKEDNIVANIIVNTCLLELRSIKVKKLLWTSCKENKMVYVQVNNYEIIINFFHVSHNLTWYSAIVHKFTRIYQVCSTYELTKKIV